MKVLIGVPVRNEADTIKKVLSKLVDLKYDVLCVDDGSTDGSYEIIRSFDGIICKRNHYNKGYGACIKYFFEFSVEQGYDILITMDADGQHLIEDVPRFIEAVGEYDFVSGSRYLKKEYIKTPPPKDRFKINMFFVKLINSTTRYNITDAFCGYRAYQVSKIKEMKILDNGYAFPIEFWLRADQLGLTFKEIPIYNLYLESNRRFGGGLDDAHRRLKYYLSVFQRAYREVRYTYSSGTS